MKFELNLPTGVYTSQDAFIRPLDHPYGPIYIVDQVFEQSFVDSLHAVLKQMAFVANEYDSDANRDVLHLKCELPAKVLLAGEVQDPGLLALLPKQKGATHLSAVARITEQALQKLYPGYTGIEIGRIHVNSIPHGDILYVHEDGWPGASLTGLYFSNSTWQPEWNGELILCDPMGESLYAIEPRPGRFVLFPGEIPHRGGAPSRACYAHRLTIGHKFRAQKQADSVNSD